MVSYFPTGSSYIAKTSNVAMYTQLMISMEIAKSRLVWLAYDLKILVRLISMIKEAIIAIPLRTTKIFLQSGIQKFKALWILNSLLKEPYSLSNFNSIYYKFVIIFIYECFS